MSGNIFDVFLIWPITNILFFFHKIFEVLHFPGPMGWSIIALTVVVRLILWPLTKAQIAAAKKMAELKPKMDELKKIHGDDKLRHQQEISKLYKEHGVNPAAGCLPLIIQIPIFIALYQAVLKAVSSDFLEKGLPQILYFSGLIPKTLDPSFLGLHLSATPASFLKEGWVLLTIPFITGFLQFIQSKMMVPQKPKKEESSPAGEEKKDQSAAQMMEQVQSQMTYLMPAMIVFFSFGFPVALSLYWNTFTVLGIFQQYKVSGWGGLEPLVKRLSSK